MKTLLILISFLLALNFVASTYYGSLVLNSEELVETNPLQEMVEKQVEKKNDFIISSFRFVPPFLENKVIVYSKNFPNNFSTYEQVVLVPPPDFLGYSS